MAPVGDGFEVTIPDSWLQGRAVYGGLSTALCLHAAMSAYDDLPPLRSTQVSFIGPAGGNVRFQSSVLRRGKSTAFINVDMTSDGQRGARVVFCFGASRESRLQHRQSIAPQVADPGECGRFFEDAEGHNSGPNFANHFNSRRAAGPLPMSSADTPGFNAWMQHRDPHVQPTLVGLIALADTLPPAAMACFDGRAPVSSMTWMFDLLTPAPATTDGWWLCRSQAESIADGYASQAMTVWNVDREPVLIGRQNVAVFY